LIKTTGGPIALPKGMIQLASYSTKGFDRGASRIKEAAWILAKWLFFLTALPWPSALRCALLRFFGAKVGSGVVIRGNVNITFPWWVVIGSDVWVGEEVIILSLASVKIESNVCISQRAFLCTGSHDFQKDTFDLIAKPITIREGAWVAAQAFIGPGVEVGKASRISAGSVISKNIPPESIARGNPAVVTPISSAK
jgi:putative colanic acid biosynthesis acetyltransferase WcaF